MKHMSNDRGFFSNLVAIIVVLLVAAAGVAIYTLNKSHQKGATIVTISPSSLASPAAAASATPALSDQELITSAVKKDVAARNAIPLPGSEIILRKLQDNYARVDINVSHGSGYFYLLKKKQDAWNVSYMGQGIDSTKEAQLGFPQDFTNTPPFESTVLYIY